MRLHNTSDTVRVRPRTQRRKGYVRTVAHIALLRGINVGGNNKLPMEDLRAMFVRAGCGEVATYIQSGNVVYEVRATRASKVATFVESAIRERFGYRIPVVTRTAEELRGVAEENPFVAARAPLEELHVMFLADAPSASRLASLDPNRSPHDRWAARTRELYLHLPNGVGQSKLTNAYLDSTLGTVSTGRNWRTVLKLVELSRR